MNAVILFRKYSLLRDHEIVLTNVSTNKKKSTPEEPRHVVYLIIFKISSLSLICWEFVNAIKNSIDADIVMSGNKVDKSNYNFFYKVKASLLNVNIISTIISICNGSNNKYWKNYVFLAQMLLIYNNTSNRSNTCTEVVLSPIIACALNSQFRPFISLAKLKKTWRKSWDGWDHNKFTLSHSLCPPPRRFLLFYPSLVRLRASFPPMIYGNCCLQNAHFISNPTLFYS